MRLKKETRITLYAAAWFLTVVMGLAGISTYYASNPSPLGAFKAICLFAGFLFVLKAASALLFDYTVHLFIRFISGLVVVAILAIDVFAFSHNQQTGIMSQVEQARLTERAYVDKSSEMSTLQAQLGACPPTHYTKCKEPLINRLNALHKDRQGIDLNSENAGERSYWESLTAWYNEGKTDDKKIDAGTMALYVYALLGALGSLFVVFGFGIHGASENKEEFAQAPQPQPTTPPPPKPTGTDDRTTTHQSTGSGNNGIGFGVPSVARPTAQNYTHARGEYGYTPSPSSERTPTRSERIAADRWGTHTPSTLGNLALASIESEPSVPVRSMPLESVPTDKSDSYERTSTLDSDAEYAQANQL